MTILWCGQEDCDFVGSGGGTVFGGIPGARTAVAAGVPTYSSIFTPVTSLWFSYTTVSVPYGGGEIGIINNESKSGLWFGRWETGLAVEKTNLLTSTFLACESLNSLGGILTITRVDVNIQNYSTSGLVRMYSNGQLAVEYQGDLVQGDGGALNQVLLYSHNQYGGTNIIVSTTDTRLLHLVTLYPNAAGSVNEWSGSYADIGEASDSTSTLIYTDDPDQEFQCNVSPMIAGSYSIKAVGLAYKAAKGSEGLLLQHGLNSGGTTALDTAIAIGDYWESHNVIYETNPVTSNPFELAEIDGLQIAFKTVSV